MKDQSQFLNRILSTSRFAKLFFILLLAIILVAGGTYYLEHKPAPKHVLGITTTTNTNPLMQKTTPDPLIQDKNNN